MAVANLDRLLKSIVDVVQAVAPMLGQQNGAVAAGALSRLIEDAKAAAGPRNAAVVAQLAALQARINAHAGQTILSSARGGDPTTPSCSG
jgi:hypothetical protein